MAGSAGDDAPGGRLAMRVRRRGSLHETVPLAPRASGLTLGSASPVVFFCHGDPQVDAEHGTLECTSRHGVWVYVDHSTRGSVVYGAAGHVTKVHGSAVVVHSGDRLVLGSTEIELVMSSAESKENQSEEAEMAAEMAAERRPRLSPSQLAKQQIPRIDTLGSPPRAGKDAATVTPAYINSPIPGVNWRKKRNSIATATVRMPLFQGAAVQTPSPPTAPAQPLTYQRGRTFVSSGNQQTTTPTSAAAPPPPPPPPPPSEYGPMPTATSSPFLRRLREDHKTIEEEPQETANRAAGYIPPEVTSAPKSHRDDLRIQVSKKMAAAALEGRSAGDPRQAGDTGRRHTAPAIRVTGDEILSPKPSNQTKADRGVHVTRMRPQLEFAPPSSPVPHKDILRQKESLLTILKHKYKEEQMLKQQQEEWMQTQMNMSRDGDNNEEEGERVIPQVSPIRSRLRAQSDPATSNNDEAEREDDLGLIPARLPELMRTISAGERQPSPRLTAALLASRASRAKARYQDAYDSFPDDGDKNVEEDGVCQVEESDSISVSSSLSTERACFRRITRSLSVASSHDESVPSEPGEYIEEFFAGYEEEEDDPTSFSFYGPDELSSSREGSSLLVIGSTTHYSYESSAPASVSSSVSSSMSIPLSPTSKPQAARSSASPFSTDTLRSPRRLAEHSPAARRKSQPVQDGRTRDLSDDEHWSRDAFKTANASSDNNRPSFESWLPVDRPIHHPSRNRRRQSAPPATLKLGLPTSKLKIASPLPRHAEPEDDDSDSKTEDTLAPLPSTSKPDEADESNGAKTPARRPSFRRRSAFALA